MNLLSLLLMPSLMGAMGIVTSPRILYQPEVGGAGAGPASRAARDEVRDVRALRRSWAQLIKRIYEVDPLVCPSCGSEMKVVAFIIDHAVVDKILRHLKRRGEGQRERGPPERSKLAAVS